MSEGIGIKGIDARLKALEDANRRHSMDLYIFKHFLKVRLLKEGQIESSIRALDSMPEIIFQFYERDHSKLEEIKSHIEAFRDFLSEPT